MRREHGRLQTDHHPRQALHPLQQPAGDMLRPALSSCYSAAMAAVDVRKRSDRLRKSSAARNSAPVKTIKIVETAAIVGSISKRMLCHILRCTVTAARPSTNSPPITPSNPPHQPTTPPPIPPLPRYNTPTTTT